MTELDSTINRNLRLFDRFSRESLLVILVSVCVIITAGTWIRMNTLIDAMADIKGGYEVNIRQSVESDDALKKEVRLLQLKIDHSTTTGEN